jgi:dTDP-4-dehydrorhamnose 3,5-epimerase
MTGLNYRETYLPGLFEVNRLMLSDSRGFLTRLFCKTSLEQVLGARSIRQVNHTHTKYQGTVRGMHYQVEPHREAKIVTCIQGKVWDIVVDIRKGSSTFLKHYCVELSADEPLSLYIPEGFAHGFQTLTDACAMVYLHTSDYNELSERGLNAADPALEIQWPLRLSNRSERDLKHEFLKDNFQGI